MALHIVASGITSAGQAQATGHGRATGTTQARLRFGRWSRRAGRAGHRLPPQRVDEAAGERAERIQAHAERVARDIAYDATERRVTDLYGQAVEQLGHDKAAVRLGGLYSLERLAQDHPDHRQTVTDVICAYLRMPFQFPSPATQENHGNRHDPADTARQELQVRLAAQRLLKRHLATPPQQDHPVTYWDDMQIDLTGAHLVHFNFSNCRPVQAIFIGANFTGDADFNAAQFCGDARFYGAQFSGNARFYEAQFSRMPGFGGAQFGGDAGFYGAQFSGDARFYEAQFRGNADFNKVQFSGDANFNGAQFSQVANFYEALFLGSARFYGAKFSGDVNFNRAQFSEDASFDRTQFCGDANFNEAQFQHEPTFVSAAASYPNDAHVWPTLWRVEPASLDNNLAHLIREQ